MNLHVVEEDGHEPDPELIAGLTQLFHDRASRFEERPMSYERLEAAAMIRPVSRRVEYLLAVAAVLFVVGTVVGLTVWNGADETSLDPSRGFGLADEVNGQTDADISSEANEDLDTSRSTFGDLTPSTTSVDEVAIASASDPDESSSDSSAPEPLSNEPSNPVDSDNPPDAITPTTEANIPTITPAPSTATTAEQPEPTATTATAGQQLASPNLGRLAPHHTNGQVELSVAWDAVPGATQYENVYSLDGEEIVRVSTAGTSERPVAIAWHQGTPGREYCLRVVATSPTRPTSEPSVVCSVNTSPMSIVLGTVREGDPPKASAIDATWTDDEAVDQYEVLTSLNGQTYELVMLTAQPRANIDLRGRTGRFCVILRALDGRGSRIQSAAECTEVLP